ncbi:MAG: AhpC/TSA family protein, partial [Odoribacteraceae bacterium]|nr:AhpC/TSA family protein [Odoribacteraceae bacterium]
NTLATGKIKNGQFQLTGKVEKPTIARLTVEGEAGACMIFLENNNTYIVQNGRAEAATEGQKLINQYDDVIQSFITFRVKLLEGINQLNNFIEMTAFQSVVAPEAMNLQKRLSELVNANPDSELSAYLLYSFGMAGGGAHTLVGLLGENARASAYGKALETLKPSTELGDALTAKMASFSTTGAGQAAPDFTLPTPAGDDLSLYGVKGKLKFIDFWASWCGPCRAENPNVLEVYAGYHSKGLEVISVSVDTDKEKWLKAIEEDHLPWLHACDLKGITGPVALLYDVKFVPYNVLVDENNKIIVTNLRGAALKTKIAELLD